MNPQFDELTLSAYVDGELDPATMQAVDGFLEKHADARAYVLDAFRANARLRGAMNTTLHEEVPQRLIDVVHSYPGKKEQRSFMSHPFLRMAAAIVLVLLGFGSGIILDRQSNTLSPLMPGPFPALYSDVVDHALEFNLSGIARQWQAPQDSLAVTVTPVKTYRDKSGRYFREYRLEIASAQERRQVKGLAYRTGAGKWKTSAVFYQ